MTASVNLAMEILENAAKKKGYVLIIDGAIPTGSNGIYCTTGEKTAGNLPYSKKH